MRGTKLFGGTLVLAALAVFGALQLEFLCDDAYIAFRYVANAHDGNGLVWNVAPFQPVEGYTCFLWVMVLWAVWSWFDVAPPESANVLSIGFGLCLLAVTAVAASRLRDRSGRPLSVVAVLLGLLFVATNRTFLTWWTSGLETALFNLAFVSWVVLAFRRADLRSAAWLLLWSTTAAVAALTRPDGLLLVGATGAVVVVTVLRGGMRAVPATLSMAPLAAVVAHVLWRRSYYGEWLPNTYYAKVTEPWPEAGLRFLGCFLLEHGAWLWPPIVLVWALAELARGPGRALRAIADNLPALAAVGALLFHLGYYVIRVGGDPFEYRVLSHLVPLGGLGVLAIGARLRGDSALAIAGTLLVGVASLLGWAHYCYQEPTLTPFYRPIEPKVPSLFAPLARWHDRQQSWLHVQVLCGRPEVHAMFLEGLRRELPERSRREVDPDDLPVAAYKGVGLPGWVLPDVAILDLHGLNDWAVARAPTGGRSARVLMPDALLQLLLGSGDADGDGRYTGAELRAVLAALPGLDHKHVDGLVAFLLLQFGDEAPDSLTRDEMERVGPFFGSLRFMAHERLAPQAYVEDLDPNVHVTGREVVTRTREVPLTPARVREIEADWRRRTLEQQGR
jgi:arabinofuranosyltransferase